REDLRAKISKNSRFVRPVLRDKFFYKAAKLISAAMDISDGLAQDLPRLLEASGVGARWIARPSEAALQSGEEYEILFSFAPKFLPKIYAIAAKAGVAINIIAEVCPRTPQSSMEFRGSSHHFAP
ncbi:AIR synthase-related protein, partial [uncultured Campylobacter sp.]|uniref:AIR synthase-related protein n=1 Tax=uncultured Campylobacter sp. TaxID=218934 RepID=UPI0026019D39